jgi:membrane protein implicated in regulation of membrane protease activity
MAGVRQVRVSRNVLGMFVFCAFVLWLVRTRLWEHRDALVLGLAGGLVYGPLRWWRLRRRIARRDRRYERNKIFVHYLNGFEATVAAVAHNPLLVIPLGLVLLAAALYTTLSAQWWTILLVSFGLAGTGVLAGCIVWYERRHGPLHYQYKSDTWSGAEGLLYQEGAVVQPLIPAGKVAIRGVLWNAVSLSGEAIDVGERIEVIAVERLTLYVDRLPDPAVPQQP